MSNTSTSHQTHQLTRPSFLSAYNNKPSENNITSNYEQTGSFELESIKEDIKKSAVSNSESNLFSSPLNTGSNWQYNPDHKTFATSPKAKNGYFFSDSMNSNFKSNTTVRLRGSLTHNPPYLADPFLNSHSTVTGPTFDELAKASSLSPLLHDTVRVIMTPTRTVVLDSQRQILEQRRQQSLQTETQNAYDHIYGYDHISIDLPSPLSVTPFLQTKNKEKLIERSKGSIKDGSKKQNLFDGFSFFNKTPFSQRVAEDLRRSLSSKSSENIFDLSGLSYEFSSFNKIDGLDDGCLTKPVVDPLICIMNKAKIHLQQAKEYFAQQNASNEQDPISNQELIYDETFWKYFAINMSEPTKLDVKWIPRPADVDSLRDIEKNNRPEFLEPQERNKLPSSPSYNFISRTKSLKRKKSSKKSKHPKHYKIKNFKYGKYKRGSLYEWLESRSRRGSSNSSSSSKYSKSDIDSRSSSKLTITSTSSNNDSMSTNTTLNSSSITLSSDEECNSVKSKSTQDNSYLPRPPTMPFFKDANGNRTLNSQLLWKDAINNMFPQAYKWTSATSALRMEDYLAHYRAVHCSGQPVSHDIRVSQAAVAQSQALFLITMTDDSPPDKAKSTKYSTFIVRNSSFYVNRDYLQKRPRTVQCLILLCLDSNDVKVSSTPDSFTYGNQLGAVNIYEKEHLVNADQYLKLDSLDNSNTCVSTLDQPDSTHLLKEKSKNSSKVSFNNALAKFSSYHVKPLVRSKPNLVPEERSSEQTSQTIGNNDMQTKINIQQQNKYFEENLPQSCNFRSRETPPIAYHTSAVHKSQKTALSPAEALTKAQKQYISNSAIPYATVSENIEKDRTREIILNSTTCDGATEKNAFETDVQSKNFDNSQNQQTEAVSNENNQSYQRILLSTEKNKSDKDFKINHTYGQDQEKSNNTYTQNNSNSILNSFNGYQSSSKSPSTTNKVLSSSHYVLSALSQEEKVFHNQNYNKLNDNESKIDPAINGTGDYRTTKTISRNNTFNSSLLNGNDLESVLNAYESVMKSIFEPTTRKNLISFPPRKNSALSRNTSLKVDKNFINENSQSFANNKISKFTESSSQNSLRGFVPKLQNSGTFMDSSDDGYEGDIENDKRFKGKVNFLKNIVIPVVPNNSASSQYSAQNINALNVTGSGENKESCKLVFIPTETTNNSANSLVTSNSSEVETTESSSVVSPSPTASFTGPKKTAVTKPAVPLKVAGNAPYTGFYQGPYGKTRPNSYARSPARSGSGDDITPAHHSNNNKPGIVLNSANDNKPPETTMITINASNVTINGLSSTSALLNQKIEDNEHHSDENVINVKHSSISKGNSIEIRHSLNGKQNLRYANAFPMGKLGKLPQKSRGNSNTTKVNVSPKAKSESGSDEDDGFMDVSTFSAHKSDEQSFDDGFKTEASDVKMKFIDTQYTKTPNIGSIQEISIQDLVKTNSQVNEGFREIPAVRTRQLERKRLGLKSMLPSLPPLQESEPYSGSSHSFDTQANPFGNQNSTKRLIPSTHNNSTVDQTQRNQSVNSTTTMTNNENNFTINRFNFLQQNDIVSANEAPPFTQNAFLSSSTIPEAHNTLGQNIPRTITPASALYDETLVEFKSYYNPMSNIPVRSKSFTRDSSLRSKELKTIPNDLQASQQHKLQQKRSFQHHELPSTPKQTLSKPLVQQSANFKEPISRVSSALSKRRALLDLEYGIGMGIDMCTDLVRQKVIPPIGLGELPEVKPSSNSRGISTEPSLNSTNSDSKNQEMSKSIPASPASKEEFTKAFNSLPSDKTTSPKQSPITEKSGENRLSKDKKISLRFFKGTSFFGSGESEEEKALDTPKIQKRYRGRKGRFRSAPKSNYQAQFGKETSLANSSLFISTPSFINTTTPAKAVPKIEQLDFKNRSLPPLPIAAENPQYRLTNNENPALHSRKDHEFGRINSNLTQSHSQRNPSGPWRLSVSEEPKQKTVEVIPEKKGFLFRFFGANKKKEKKEKKKEQEEKQRELISRLLRDHKNAEEQQVRKWLNQQRSQKAKEVAVLQKSGMKGHRRYINGFGNNSHNQQQSLLYQKHHQQLQHLHRRLHHQQEKTQRSQSRPQNIKTNGNTERRSVTSGISQGSYYNQDVGYYTGYRSKDLFGQRRIRKTSDGSAVFGVGTDIRGKVAVGY